MSDKFYDKPLHDFEAYEKSHAPRYDFLIKDLELDRLQGKRIADIGFGLGNFYSRMKDTDNYYIGVDYTDYGQIIHKPHKYFQQDLNYPFAADILKTEDKCDVAFLWETCEHLTNPLSCLNEIKKLLIPDGVLYLSIPTEQANHPILYPGLFEFRNFCAFLGQMAFKIEDCRVHTAAFSQYVFCLLNKDWSHSVMTVDKTNEPKYRNISPMDYVNL